MAIHDVTVPVSTATSDELVVALVAANSGVHGVVEASVTGGGLAWRLLDRTNSNPGTAEVWWARSPAPLHEAGITASESTLDDGTTNVAITVLTFKDAAIGAHAGAAARGAPTVSVTPKASGSFVVGAGFDWDSATARTPAHGQRVLYQRSDQWKNTFWMQSVNERTTAGKAVTLVDTAPTANRFNFNAVEIMPADGPTPAPTTTTEKPQTTTTEKPQTTTTGPQTTTTRPQTTTTLPPPTGGLAVSVSGNHLVDGSGRPLILRGGNVSGTEFTCAQNWTDDAYGGQPLGDVNTFRAMASWKINVARVPLNEDCWLGINGVQVGGTAYRNAIANEVRAAHAAGLYVILDLHWSAPGSQRALSQNPVPDQDHSPAFWSSVASTYKADHGVIFDLYNEPYSYWGTNPDPWAGWRDGDTQTQYVTGGSPYTVSANWRTAGMQQLLDTVRSTGATQPVLINGLDWANDVSGWLSHAPVDPLKSIIVGSHVYNGQPCSNESCWNSVYPALEARYPVLVGETGDNTSPPVGFLPGFLAHADAHGWNYVAWTWNPWQYDANVLITDWSGTPTAGEGVTWKNHLLAAG